MTTKSTSQETVELLARIAETLEKQTAMMEQKNDIILKNQKKMREEIYNLREKYQKFDKVLARAERDIVQEEQIAKAQERKVIKLRSDESDFAEGPDEESLDEDVEAMQLSIDDYPLDGEEKGQEVDLQPVPRVQHTEEEIARLQKSIEEVMGQKLQIAKIGEEDDDEHGSADDVSPSDGAESGDVSEEQRDVEE